MAIVQDKLGNYYDDGTGNRYDTSYSSPFGIVNYSDQSESSFGGENVFDPTYGGQFSNMPSVDEDFSPTYGQYNGLPAGINMRSIFGGGANTAPTNTGGNVITDFLKSLNLKEASAAAGALAGATGLLDKPQKRSGYQGGIPQLQAVRNMVLAPPTANYRPGQGGVNYNADVFYAPAGTVPAGMMGTMTPAAQVAAANAARAAATTPKKSSALSNIAKTAGLAALAKQVLGGTGNKTTDGLKTLIDKIIGTGAGTKNVIGTGAGAKNVIGTGTNTGLAGVINAAIKGGAGAPTKTGGGGGGSGVGAGRTADTNKIADDGTTEGIQEIVDDMGTNEFLGIDDQVKANEENPAAQILSDEEVDAELARVAAETDNEYVTGEDVVINNDADQVLTRSLGGSNTGSFTGDDDGYYDYTGDMSNTDYGGYDFDGFDFGSNDLDLSEFELGGGDDFSFGLGDYDFARGGEINMAKGRYLQGNTDGMADKIPAKIGKKQPAALSHGEFVVPADVVSHLGNGNSDAGAKKLYQMMDRIRVARTGNKQQGKQINPDKFMPGGLAKAYAAGGSVKRFVNGGTTGNTSKDLAGIASAGITGSETSPNTFAGDYIANMLGKTQALAESPYQQYMGPLTAGESPLQTGAFNTAAGLTTPKSVGDAATTAGNIATKASDLTYSPTTFTNQYTAPTAYSPTTSSFDAAQATAYMNPYLKASLDPQLAEARRQSEITQNLNNAQMTRAGAYGGGRQAILNAETQRNLGTNLANITGQGYNTAFNNAMQQFNADQARKMQEAQFGAQQGMSAAQLGAQYGLAGQQAAEQSKQFGKNFGLQGLQTGLQAAQAQGALGAQQSQIGLANLAQQLAAGQQQRGIEAEGIAADKATFEAARENPYKMLQFQQSMLQGMPISATSYDLSAPSTLTKASQGAVTVNQLLKNLGLFQGK